MISCLLLSLTVLSQVDTVGNVLILSERVAKEVLKDLERLDQCDSVHSLNTSKIQKLESELRIQNMVMLGSQEQIFNLNTIIGNKDGVIDLTNQETDHWKKQYKKQKRQKFLVGGIGLFLLVLASM